MKTQSYASLPSVTSPCAHVLGTDGVNDAYIPLYPGLYLMSGPKGVGKTSTSLALSMSVVTATALATRSAADAAAYLQQQRSNPNSSAAAEVAKDVTKAVVHDSCYRGLLEPRAQATAFEMGVSDQGMLNQGDVSLFADPIAGFTKIVESVAAGAPKVIVLDSVTHFLSLYGYCLTVKKNVPDTTLPGGMPRSAIWATLAIDALAREQRVAVVATVNSELFPRVDILEGACEAQMEITQGYTIVYRDRGARKMREVRLNNVVTAQALSSLGYSANQTQINPFTISRIL